jgi:hypothetical protein
MTSSKNIIEILRNILEEVVTTLLWNDDAEMVRVPCRVNREKITM